ncbi:carbohydrate-binding CenC domain protein [Bacillus phage 035JT001]|nr:carbohydrate-binding CenC domain protein [Bacillus phage 035JT001]
MYRFYAKIATVQTTKYLSNPNLNPDTNYIYEVSAVNAAGYESEKSAKLLVRTKPA